ncbi:N-acetylmannosamine-6-phosphate 2-epimerase [Peribacillus sp. SCS-155]|uniref:N-acetylmannosamine-6-phosphate 2-epimerase n=1 Tax=Peribacillus sedimenti TaxID=3115297 RepID=UPI0039067754
MNLERLKHGVVVSCQARVDHPLNDPHILTRMALAAEMGGAAAIRADHPDNIRLIKERVKIPVIGIYKVPTTIKGRYFITPTFDHAKRIVEAGADIVAIEATSQFQPSNKMLEQLIRSIHSQLGVPVMADISTVEEGERAWGMGADFVATTLSGYTEESNNRPKPDFPLIKSLVERGIRSVCEGHIRTPEDTKRAFEQGAHFVVIGTAITDPVSITSWHVHLGRSEG